MKRSNDTVDDSPSDVQPSKRPNLTEDNDSALKADFVLSNQNKYLSLELSKQKRSLVEARKELEMMRKKTQEMESLVSLIQRAWSQLDIDTSLLLDGLADPEVEIPSSSSELFQRFVHSSDKYIIQDPSNVQNLPQLNVDQWSSAPEIEKAKSIALSSLAPIKSSNDGIQCFGDHIEEHLQSHIAFTYSILERLCYAVSEGGTLVSNVETLKSLQLLKESRSKESLLIDGLTKLESEMYIIQSKCVFLENQKLKVEKQLDRAIQTIKELEEKLNNHGNNNAGPISTENEEKLTVLVKAGLNDNQQELVLQISTLEKQLAESESAKAEAEMHLTERISRPLMQSDVQVADMRKAMEELRSQYKQRLNAVLEENRSLREKIKDLQYALTQVEGVAAKKVEAYISAIESEFNKLKDEKNALEVKLKSSVPLSQSDAQWQKLCQEYQSLEEMRNSKITSLENEIKSMKETYSQVQRNVEKSRKREKYLESVILHYGISLPDAKARPISRTSSSTPLERQESFKSISNEAKQEVGNSEDNIEKLKIDQVTQQLVKLAQERSSDLEKELTQVKSSVNDLITEIEGISNVESSIRIQSESLLKQVNESQTMQQAVLEENLKLINDLEELRSRKTDAETKCELMKNVLIERDKMLSAVRNEEFTQINELNQYKKVIKEVEESKQAEKERNEELQQKLDDLLVKFQETQKRNQDLQARCNELSKQCQKERRIRQEEQRKDKKNALKRESSIGEDLNVPSFNHHDADMLEMTLGMLRCSVCKDRFKSVTIKKCFHLFCRECIEENIRSRSRKCPACGEKFGQDDVANIYFTN